MNTHVRDNLSYLKLDPVIAVGGGVNTINTNNANAVAVDTLGPVTIPSDIGACFVEVWSHVGYGLTTAGAGTNDRGVFVTDGAVYLINGQTTGSQLGIFPYYARSADLAWAGQTKTVYTYINGYSSAGGANGRMVGATVRIVRSY